MSTVLNKRHQIRKLFYGKILVYFLLITGSIIMIAPFLWMLSTSLKEKRSVHSSTIELIPRSHIRVSIGSNKKELLYTSIIDGKKEQIIELDVTQEGRKVKIYKNGTVSRETYLINKDNMQAVKKFKPMWRNYIDAWQAAPFGRYYINSIIVAIFVTIGQVLTSSLAAYAFARLKFPFRNQLFFGYLATMMIPGTVTMIPNFIILQSFGWINTYQALILPAMFTAYGTFLLRQFFLSIPKDLEESAFIGGAHKLRIYWSIIMPLSKPALATLSMFTFMGAWNNLIWPLIVTTSVNMRTLPLGLQLFQGIYETEWTLLMAASVIVLVPVLIFYLFNQRFFTRGIVLSGLKG